ncbi:DNA-processing protein DprA [Zongyangia hominis]|uniref:DNA-protecting protein DprA n=1 Tax=Zongyangia hominis TaxID=2763677 RepID=A0A926IAM5_9FIRM|nr:DNA-processing protein DprA [Zongyangia hominis]MBC8569252.1 DNA-protecting protein DprA [Zongyangia hominis]
MVPVSYWIWLQSCLSQGSGLISDILEAYGDPKAFYEAVHACDPEVGLAGLPTLTHAQLSKCAKTPLSVSDPILERCQKAGCTAIGCDHPDYPDRLRYIYAPPAVLYYRGALAGLDEIPIITVVGTRKMTEYGRKAAVEFGTALAQAGIGVVSGMAVGVDITAMKAALKQGGYVIGVTGCGIDVNYPVENEKMRHLVAKYGCLISEYPPGTGVRKGHFPVRNRILAGLGLGALVIQAPGHSGSLITADYALEQGKDLFVVPGNLYDPTVAGNLRMLRDGCTPATEPSDVVDTYRFPYEDVLRRERLKNKERRAGRPLPPAEEAETPANLPNGESGTAPPRPTEDLTGKAGLPQDKQAPPAPVALTAPPEPKVSQPALEVFRLLGEAPMHMDEIAGALEMRISEVLCALTELEIVGAIRTYSGRRYGKKGETP